MSTFLHKTGGIFAESGKTDASIGNANPCTDCAKNGVSESLLPPIDSNFFGTPFLYNFPANGVKIKLAFNNANTYMAEGKYTVTWAFNHTPNVEAWRATVVTALATYATDQTDANWAAVEDAFVNGWALEYSIQNTI